MKVIEWGLAASVWATTIGNPVIEHAANPLLVITIGVPSLPPAPCEKPRLSERIRDAQVVIIDASAFEDPSSMPKGENERAIALVKAAKVRMPLALRLNSNLQQLLR